VKVLALRRAGVCGCGAQLPAGTRACWDRLHRAVLCLDRLGEGLRLSVAGQGVVPDLGARAMPEQSVADCDAAEEPRARTSPTETSPTVVDVGNPGSWLQTEHEPRAASREARARARHPRIGGFLLAVTKEPASTTAFSTGAAGERRVAARLAELSGPGVLSLHNRLLGHGRRMATWTTWR